MTTKFELFFERIKKAAGVLSDKELGEFLEIKKSTLSMWKSREKVDYDLLFTKFEHIDFNWLFTGKGDYTTTQDMVVEPKQVYKLRTDKNITDQRIPFYNLEASAGLVELFNDINDKSPIDYISIPNLPKCDGAVSVTGDSMYPLLKSGDIIMYKQLNNEISNIFFGEMYLLSIDIGGDEYVSVKWVQKSNKGDDHVRLVSENQHHQPKDVPLKKIRALALVKASVRINSMR